LPIQWLSTGLAVSTDLLIGFGTAISAPWPLLVVAGLAALRVHQRRAAFGWLFILGLGFLAGQVAEPLAHAAATQPSAQPLQTAAVAANMLLPVA
jgi:predicted membrane protein